MPQLIDVPGHGEVEFPDDMTDEQISAAIQSNLSPEPTSGMTPGDLRWAGAGRAVVNAGRGIAYGAQQIPRPGDLAGAFATGRTPRLDAVREGIAEDARLDEPLLATKEGRQGNLLGTIGVLAPTALIPGANTFSGASLIGAGSGFALTPGSAEERLGAAKYGAAGGLVGKAGGDLLAKGGRAVVGKMAERGAAKAAERSVSDATAAEARAAGYVIPPTQTNPTGFNRFLEGIAGKVTTAQQASSRNMAVVNNDARKVLGIGGKGQIGDADIERAMTPHLAPYKEAAQISPDAKFALEQWRRTNDDLRDLWKDYAKNSRVETKRAIEQARAEADGWLGAVEAEAAKIGNGGLASRLKSARVQLARIGTVEDVLNEGSGNVSIPQLAAMLKAGKRIPDELQTAAKLGRAHPEATRQITSSLPGWSPLDAYVAAGAIGADAYTGNGLNPGLLAVALARPAVRNALLSKSFQGGAKYGPNALVRGGVDAVENRITRNALTRASTAYGQQE